MAGLTTAGRQCHPTNPPPTRYKPPRMISASPSRNLLVTQTENQVSRPTGKNRTTTYVAATKPPSKSDEKSTMTANASVYKLPIFPKLQKSIKMKNMHSNYARSTTVTSTSTLTRPMQLPINTSITAHLHDPYDRSTNSKIPSPPTQTSSTTIPNTDFASTPSTNPQPNTKVQSTGKMLDFNRHQNVPHITRSRPCLPIQCPTNLPSTKCCPTDSHTPPTTANFPMPHHPASLSQAKIPSTTPKESHRITSASASDHITPLPPPSPTQFPQLDDIKRLLEEMIQQLNVYLSITTTSKSANHSTEMKPRFLKTPNLRSSRKIPHVTHVNLYDLISTLLPATYLQLIPANQTPPTATKITQLLTTASANGTIGLCTYKYSPTTTQPTPSFTLPQPMMGTILRSYLQHTFPHAKDLLKPA